MSMLRPCSPSYSLFNRYHLGFTNAGCFLFLGKYYKLIFATLLGSPLPPLIVDIFMVSLKEIALQSRRPVTKGLWLRYNDDTFIIWPPRGVTLQSV